MEGNEAVIRFIRAKLKILLRGDPFPDGLYKQTKRQYFVVQLNNTAGTPRDAEVAHECLVHLVKTGQVRNKEKLDYFLSLPFFKSHIRDIQGYVEYLNLNILGKSTVAIDPSQLEKQEYRQTVEGEIRKKVLEEGTEEIDRRIYEKKREYDALPSVLDQADFPEPAPEPAILEDRFLPWWKKLGLKADPFPSEGGLHRIARELYEKVVF